MKRWSKPLWDIVPQTVRAKVARDWEDRAATAAYLRTRVQTTLRSRDAIRTAAVPAEHALWAAPRAAADTDLARVYAFAAWTVQHYDCDTYADFRTALNRIRVGQLAAHLDASDAWSAATLRRAAAGLLPMAAERDG